MVPCCDNEFGNIERYDTREELIKEASNYAAEYQLDPTCSVTSELKNKDDERLIQVFRRFVTNIRDKDLLWQHGIVLVANSKGHILELATSSDLPDFLVKKETEYFDWSLKAISSNAIGITAKTCKSCYVFGDEHFLEPLKNYQTTSVPICDSNKKLVGILGFISTAEYKGAALGCLQGLLVGFEIALQEYGKILTLEREAQKREALFTMTQTLYSTVDVNEVLSEAIKNFYLFYPNAKLQLWMTQEFLIPNLPIKQMTFIPSREDINGQAFLEARIIVKRRDIKESGELAAPLKGKQGVYGVIHISCNELVTYTEEEVRFISSVADIIGHAFENAKLYQQSNNMVKELQVINELTKRLNQSLNKESILQFVIIELTKLFDAQFVCVLHLNDKKDLLTVIGSNVGDNVGKSVPSDNGYMGLVYKNQEPIIVSDVDIDTHINDSYVNNLQCRSLMSVPIFANDELIGVLSVSSQSPQHFSYDDFKMLQVFAQHLGLALTNALLHEKIQQLAIIDYLTSLYNRSYLDGKIQDSQNNDLKGTLILFDIDDFKKINDTYGHQIGDQILIQVASILKGCIRATDIAARWGGEEVALYLPNVNTDIAKQIGERILKQIREETNPKVTISGGIATWDKEDDDVDVLTIVRKADQALYEAKRNGKDQIIIFE